MIALSFLSSIIQIFMFMHRELMFTALEYVFIALELMSIARKHNFSCYNNTFFPYKKTTNP